MRDAYSSSEDAVLHDLAAGRVTVVRALARLPGRSRKSMRDRMVRLSLPIGWWRAA